MNLYMVEAYIVIFTYQELFHFFFFFAEYQELFDNSLFMSPIS